MTGSWVVAQLGSRMHYAVPRLLHEAGMLARLYTDICAVKGWPRLLQAVPPRLRPDGLKRLLGRVPQGVPARRITAFSRFGWRYARRCAAARSSGERTAAYLWAGKRFAELVLGQGLGSAEGVYTFNSAGLEVLRYARGHGLRTVLEQTIAPRAVEDRLLAEEHQRFPAWEGPALPDDQTVEFAQRERAEWEQAELIVCGSEFVRQGIAACGGPVDRCVVVPYGVDERFAARSRRRHEGPLRVLTVGAVGLRKGSPYVLEAARRLRGRAVFRLVGPVGASEAAVRELRREVQVVGPVPRAEIMDHYAWADVFLLPSICEGSATVTYEALMAGLPVVCTPNTGSVVRDGVEGFVVPIRDVQAVADRLEETAARPDFWARMSRQAVARAQDFTFARYRDRLITQLKANHGPDRLADC